MNVDDFFRELYQNFNNRKIELVIELMTNDVKWANGMEGGYVYGHEGVREYWTRQFTIVSAKVSPQEITQENDIVKIKVHQVVRNLNGNLLADETVFHYFTFKDGKVAEFNIGEKTTN